MELLANLSSLEVLALTIYGEARGEPIQGQIAVGNVVKNRSLTWRRSINDICLAPKQFSCWNENDPNRVILEEIAQKLQLGQDVGDRYFQQCHFLAKGIVDDYLMDNSGSALYYMTTSLFLSDKRPKWAEHFKTPKTVGNHIFFNL